MSKGRQYRVVFFTGTPLKVLSVRLHSKSHQKVSEFTYRLALRIFRGVAILPPSLTSEYNNTPHTKLLGGTQEDYIQIQMI